MKEKSTVQIQEFSKNNDISNTQEKLDETKEPYLPIKKIPQTPNTDYEHETLWYLEFDGSVNKLGAGARTWVHNQENDHVEGHAYRLNFKCTNNMAEYEALLLGLKLIKSLGAVRISILGDSDLIIQQIKGNFLTIDPRLKAYRQTTIEILNTFLETQLAKIPRKHNLHAHSLATFANTCKLLFEPNHQFTTEIRHMPTILDNVKNWQVFDNDAQINNFLTLKENFSSTNIYMDVVDDIDQIDKIETNISAENATQIFHPTKFTKKKLQELKEIDIDEAIGGEFEVIDLKDNYLPTGLTPLEDFFDSNDILKKPKMQPLNADIEDCNIGTKEIPKMIKLSNTLPPDQKLKYVELFKEFQDVFAWSYEDLKSYDTSAIQHTIPLKENQ